MEPVETPVESVTAAVYVIPTDGPESDGTLAWDSTTMIVVTALAADVTGLGWTYGSPAASKVIADHLAPVVVGGDSMDVPGAAVQAQWSDDAQGGPTAQADGRPTPLCADAIRRELVGDHSENDRRRGARGVPTPVALV